MTMLQEHNLTEARKGLSTLYSEVFHSLKPAIITRNNSEEVLLLRADLQKMLLSHFSLRPRIIEEKDNSITLVIDQLDIYANAGTLAEALHELTVDVKAYAEDYLNRSQLFLNAPNRREHFPYILRVLMCDTDEEICGLLEL